MNYGEFWRTVGHPSQKTVPPVKPYLNLWKEPHWPLLGYLLLLEKPYLSLRGNLSKGTSQEIPKRFVAQVFSLSSGVDSVCSTPPDHLQRDPPLGAITSLPDRNPTKEVVCGAGPELVDLGSHNNGNTVLELAARPVGEGDENGG